MHRIDETGENVRHLGITKQDSIAQAHRANGLAHLRNRVRPLPALMSRGGLTRKNIYKYVIAPC